MSTLVTMTISPAKSHVNLDVVFALIRTQLGAEPRVIAQGAVRPGLVIDGLFIAVWKP